MKIVLMDSHGGLDGAQRFLLDLARGLRARRWEVMTVLGVEGPLAGVCRQMALPTHIAELPAWALTDEAPTLLQAGWRAVWQLVRLFRAEEARVLIANSLASAVLGGLAMRLAGGRVFWRMHRLSETAQSLTLTHLGYRLAERLYVPLPASADLLRLLFRSEKRLHIVPPWVDLERIKLPSRATEKVAPAPVVGMLGAWVPSSGQEVLVKAFRLLQEGGRPSTLCLAGEAGATEETRYRSVVQSAVKAAGLSERVVMREEVADHLAFLAGCDVVVIPTLTESTGRLALEALALGLPVVASRVDALCHLIEDGHTGLLVPPNQPRALADALELLLASPALRAEMGRQARIHLETHFSLHAAMQALEPHLRGERAAAGTPMLR